MQIIYNPLDGAPITSFIYEGNLKSPHYPDGFEYVDPITQKNTVANGLLQYSDSEAEKILETFEFLRQITLEQAQDILNRKEETKFKCDFPGCEFSSSAPIGLSGHKRKHAKALSEAQEPVAPENLIPVSGGRRVQSLAEKKRIEHNANSDIQNGADADGVEWYGEGMTVDNKSSSFNGVRTAGKGHFIG